MPFVSESQRRACWAKYHRDIKAGRKPAWDCKKWAKETHDKNLPYKKGHMPSDELNKSSLIIKFKQDLMTYPLKDLIMMAKYYGITDQRKFSKEDLSWMLALYIYSK